MTRIYTLTIFTSAFLLFLVQPMISKILLPYLGGSPAVWNTAMMFFETLLLLGYGYVHISSRMGPRNQACLHLAVLALAFFWLPIAAYTHLGFISALHPIPWVLLSLLMSVGLPFFALSATAPLVQSWLANTDHRDAHNPYFLYSASNAGSLLALAAYPFAVEPSLTLEGQTELWSGLFVCLAVLVAACAVYLWKHYTPTLAAQDTRGISAPAWRDKLRWVALAFFPSSLLLGVTTYITTDIASIPLFWVIPLAIYLLTIILAFARTPLMVDRALNAQIILIPLVAMALAFHINFLTQVLILHLFAFFALCMGCHGILARSKPRAKYLTGFYFWMAFGGMLGGVFNALIAPVVFTNPVEYPLIFVLALLMRPTLTSSGSARARWMDVLFPALFMALLLGGLTAFHLATRNYAAAINAINHWGGMDANGMPYVSLPQVMTVLLYIAVTLLAVKTYKRPLRFTLVIAGLMLAVPLADNLSGTLPDTVLYSERNFFGVNRVLDWKAQDAYLLMHGTTLHGIQSQNPERQLELVSYYHALEPAIDALPPEIREKPTAVLGLGIGTTACMGEKDKIFDFFEIDPAVIAIARNTRYFTYLRDCPPHVRIMLGDARLTLAMLPNQYYGLIIVDVFSSDAIPIHLLTRQALQIYLSKLADGGVIAFNISNRHLNLAPVMDALAHDAGLTALIRTGMHPGDPLYMPSVWVLMARHAEDLDDIEGSDGWQRLDNPHKMPPWTDNYSNILETLF